MGNHESADYEEHLDAARSEVKRLLYKDRENLPKRDFENGIVQQVVEQHCQAGDTSQSINEDIPRIASLR
jgi:hypothetical protein